jgi:UDP-hydrolysing UDP-N-acetyl-D-glucosamine 2-epimerase
MSHARTIAVVTGSRAEFGLLRSVIRAIRDHSGLELRVISCGENEAKYSGTESEVKAEFSDASLLREDQAIDEFRDQVSLSVDIRSSDGVFGFGERLGLGVFTLSKHFSAKPPDVVLVLGDRIEAFAAAAAASIGGIRVAHMHGGDRAEGIADEAMRHAITKLAHIHLPATQQSAQRIERMGEDPRRIHIVGSPAIDDLNEIPAMSDSEFAALGSPQIIVLLHPTGDAVDVEHARAAELFAIASSIAPTLVLHPNHDPGRAGILLAIESSKCRHIPHLPRREFVGLLRRARVIAGNSSAGLIECGAIPIHAVNIGSRQAGRERAANVIDVPEWDYQTIRTALSDAVAAPPLEPQSISHPYGDGRSGIRTAELLASIDLASHPLRKRNTY